ncbi:MAG: tRNA (N(6)-L-threonylcarbamoyladenosine(37)-C(2))-methylthiotransferase MtaB [Candidatus Symbiothrix sp.]|jgi:threonylcarbamoyladenosine tRNA methylthiotransferase MtaB|nr:tRNA (N(6)-L-threonylcarbamoyladenosine(37)-C(2))-methylthiotransferase MtaB [Candidatus Symbiothrix sp.]
MIDNHIFHDKKAAFYTLGCKLNFAETSSVGQQLAAQGVRRVQAGEEADFCIVNTCSVTDLADKKCRQAIRRLKKQHPHARMIVTGCYAQLNPKAVESIEGVDLVIGANQKHLLLDELLKSDLSHPVNAVQTLSANDEFVPACSSDDRTRHFLKVQDGCNYFCSYCTIPFARGRSRNGRIADLVAMAEQAGQSGGKEIVLTGVNIGDFGHTTGETFLQLLQALDRVENIRRFRISSIEPNLLTQEILEFIAQSQRFTPHFHIPLQSGSDEILKLMRRRYDTAFFRDKIAQVRAVMPDAFIGVDVITGMRGETERHFEETERFLETLPFSQLHVFSYSERPGTQALNIKPIVAPKDKQERSRRLLALSDRKCRAFYRSQAGTQRQVLFEHTQRNRKMYGFTENYIKIEADYRLSLVNKINTITLMNYDEEKNCYCYS